MCVHLTHTSFQFDLKHLNKPMFPHCFKFRGCIIFIVIFLKDFKVYLCPHSQTKEKVKALSYVDR